MPGWILAIDFGTSSTAAARRVGDREVERIQLEGNPRMPSMVFWREGTGSGQTGRLVLGQEADELSSLAPWCLERAPKRRLGDEFMQLGEKQLRVVEVVGAILREVTNEALSLSGGEPPSEIRLTHPARWAKSRLDKLRQAARQAGIENPTFIPEPVAAATHFASERLAVGEHVAVYDLGGGTFDTAVLERTGDSFKVIGKPGGDEELGGEDFDDLLYRHLGEQLPGETWHQLRAADGRKERSWSQANRELLRHARRAKEGLSRSPQYEFYMPQPIDQELHAGAAELERLIAPTLRGTVAELERTILAAGLKPQELAAIYLAGGSSRIPLVGRLIQERLGVMAEHLDDPKAVIALGAARLGSADAFSGPGSQPADPGATEIEPSAPALEEGAIAAGAGLAATSIAGTEPEGAAGGTGQPPPGDADRTEPDPQAPRPGEAKPAPQQPKSPKPPKPEKPKRPRSDDAAKRRRRLIAGGVGAVILIGAAVGAIVIAGGGEAAAEPT